MVSLIAYFIVRTDYPGRGLMDTLSWLPFAIPGVLLGVGLSIFTLVSFTAAFVASLRADWTRIAVRVAGSWAFAIGLLMIGWTIRG